MLLLYAEFATSRIRPASDKFSRSLLPSTVLLEVYSFSSFRFPDDTANGFEDRDTRHATHSAMLRVVLSSYDDERARLSR